MNRVQKLELLQKKEDLAWKWLENRFNLDVDDETLDFEEHSLDIIEMCQRIRERLNAT